MHEVQPKTHRSGTPPFWIVVLAATAIDIGSFFLLQYAELSPSVRIAAALLPLPGNLALMVLILRAIRKLDEFQQRVQLEAVALGFLATAVAVFVYGYLQKAHAAGPLHPWFVYLFLIVTYGIGYLAAVRRYR
jgi:hypothetical protein